MDRDMKNQKIWELLVDSKIFEPYGIVYDGLPGKSASYDKDTFEYCAQGRKRRTIISVAYKELTSIELAILNTETDGIITFSDWLMQNNHYKLQSVFSWKEDDDGFVEKAVEMFSVLKGLFEEEALSKILRGEDWEIVPFRWYNQR